MRTYVIANLKGGIGKTTSVVNIGYDMSLMGKRVLLIDADPQSNLTPFFTQAHGYTGRTIRDLFENPEKIRNIIVRSKYENIDIVKGSVKLKEADAKNEKALKTALQLVEQDYDVCLVDTRPALEHIARSAILAADVILTPVLLDNFCRDNLLLLEDEIENIIDDQEVGWKIFVNKVENKRSQRDTYADMVQKHDWEFLDTCISKGAVVENALKHYKPVLRHRRKSMVSQDYMELTKEILEV